MDLVRGIEGHAARLRALTTAFGMASLNDRGGFDVHAHPGWIAVPVESAGHFNSHEHRRLIEAVEPLGANELIVVDFEYPTTRPLDRGAYSVDLSVEGLAEFERRFASRDVQVFTPGADLALISSVWDFYIALGPRTIIETFLGMSSVSAIELFRSTFLRSSDQHWPEPLADAVARAEWERFPELAAQDRLSIYVSPALRR